MAFYVTHSDNTQCQSTGFGTFTLIGDECERAVCDAIDVGYRHIDTAFYYQNEHSVGKAVRQKIKEGVVTRDDIFVVTKLWCHFHQPELVEIACRKSLSSLGLDYIDLYLMHWPYAYSYRGDYVLMPKSDSGEVELDVRLHCDNGFIKVSSFNISSDDVDYLDTWKAMEGLVEKGLTKSIGVSNFNSEQLTRLLKACKIRPIHNQIECHPCLNQKSLINFCEQNDIRVTAYCPLGHPEPERRWPPFLYDARVREIANKHNKTPAQIVLRYLFEHNALPLPKTTNKSRMIENISIFDFWLDAEDIQFLDTFNSGKRVITMEHAKNSKYYPFHFDEDKQQNFVIIL